MAKRAGYIKQGKVGVCIMCRQVFQAARCDKKTCSDKCRKAWQRYSETLKRDTQANADKLSQIDRLDTLLNRIQDRWNLTIS